MGSGAELLGRLGEFFTIQNCKENYLTMLRPLVTQCMKSDSKHSKKKLLQKHLEFTVVSTDYPGEYDGGAILLDLIEEAVTFATDQGFPCHEICLFLSLYVSVLQAVGNLTSEEAPPLRDVIQKIQGEIIPKYSEYLPSRSLLASMDFIIKSVLQHIHLYHMLVTQPQATDLTTLDLYVDRPETDPPSLQQGVEVEAWLKAKRREEMKQRHTVKEKQMEEAHAKELSQTEADLKSLYEKQLALLSTEQKRMSVDEVSSIISALMKAHIDVAAVTLSQTLLKQSFDLDCRLEQLEVLVSSLNLKEGGLRHAKRKTSAR